MPSDPKQSPRRGWRVGGAADEGKRGWRKDATTTTPSGRRWSLRAWFWPLLILFLTTIATLIWVATRLAPPTPAYLVVLGADYAENLALPPNLYGWHSAQALHEFAQNGRWSFLWWPRPLFGGQDETRELLPLRGRTLLEWGEGLKNCKEETVIVSVTAHGGVDRRGVFFVPQDCNPYAADEKQSVSTVLYLKDLLAALPEKKNKLVLLDATAAPACWPLGQLQNDFAYHLELELKAYQDTPQLVVLSASSANQRSWASEAWGRSVFGHFILEGLAGDADQDDSGRVDCDELVKYVQDQVEAWASANRNEAQRVALFSSNGTNRKGIELVIAKKVAAPRPAPVTETALTGLKKVWDQCAELRAKVPSPAAYTPHQWRRYLDSLLRYEQVVRAGASTTDPKALSVSADKAKALLSQVESLVAEIERARQLRLKEMNNLLSTALPLPAAVGMPADFPGDKLTALWKDDEKKWEEGWGKLRRDWLSSHEGSPEALLSVKAAGQLLQQAARSPKGVDYERLSRQLQVVQRDGMRRPVEAHVLLLLQQHRNRQPEPTAEDLALAVRVSLLAEETALAVGGLADAGGKTVAAQAPSSERIYPWIHAELAQADEARRDGLDWLLGSSEAHYAKARASLKRAQTAYERLRQQTAIIREAYALRDEWLAELPYWTQWLARVRFNPDPNLRAAEHAKLRPAFEAIERLWNQVYHLNVRLQTPDLAGVEKPPERTKLEETPPSLQARLAPLKADWETLHKAFTDWSVQISELEGDKALQGRWHKIDAMLALPFLSFTERDKLLRASRDSAVKLQEGYELRSAEERKKELPPPEGDFARETTERQGRLALASLGRVWITEQAKKDAGVNYDNLLARVADPSPTERRHAGEQIGRLWRELPRAVAKLVQEINSVEDWGGERKTKDYLEAIAPRQREAAAWCRQLDGAGVGAALPAGPEGPSYDPVGDLRRCQLHTLLLALARRSWDDHWWCTLDDPSSPKPRFEDPATKKKPYFATAVETYTAAAAELIVQEAGPKSLQDLRLVKSRDLRKELPETQVRCAPRGPAKLMWTTERALPVEWTVTSTGVPRGTAMFRLLPDPLLKPAVGDEKQLMRTEHPLKGAEETRQFRLALEELSPTQVANRTELIEPAQAVLDGLFRGQPIGQRTPIDIHREPDTVVTHVPPDPISGLAVQADPQLHLGSLAIVLDVSGSMAYPLKGGTSRKIDVARRALSEVLKRVPKGTRISLWAFGQQRGAANTEEEERLSYPGRLVGPLVWDPLQFPDQPALMMKAVKDLVPRNLTPIVDSLIQAKQDLVNQPGIKTLLVLTDGHDTLFKWRADDGTKERPWKERLALIDKEVRAQFTEKENIVVNMLLFENDDKEIAKAREQFKDTVQSLPSIGTWTEVRNENQLTFELFEAMRPKLRLLRGKDVIGNPQGFKVTFTDEPGYGWSRALEAELASSGIVYDAWVNSFRQSVVLGSGERMLILLKPDPKEGIRFERGLIANMKDYGLDEKGERKSSKDSGDWRLAVLRNRNTRAVDGRSIEMHISVENASKVNPQIPEVGRNDSLLRQRWPGFVWLELTAKGERFPGLHWQNTWDYPGPTWKINHKRWPLEGRTLVKPELNVWWSEASAPVHAMLEKKGALASLRDKELTPFKSTTVVVESVDVEPRAEPGSVECLVVRLRHEPADRPVWVSLDGLVTPHAQHHFYNKAGKVTAYFWPVTRQDAEAAKFTVQLTSLPDFKAQQPLRVESKDLTPPLTVPNVEPELPKPLLKPK